MSPEVAQTLISPWKIVLTMIGTMTVILTAALSIHGNLILPSTLAQSRQECQDLIRANLSAHEVRPHVGAVTHSELERSLGMIDKRLDRIEAKLEMMSK